jgi:hypothetical protein
MHPTAPQGAVYLCGLINPVIPASAGDTPLQALQVLERFLQPRHAAAADFQRLLAMAQHRLHVAVGGTAQFDDLVARDQAVAVDADEALAELVFERLQ